MRNPVLVLFLAALVALPAASAAWGAKGDTEPNSGPDATGIYMFTSSNPQAKNKVYLNGFGGMCVGAWVVCSSTSFNPNLGSLGTGVPVYPFQAYAMLGVWRDCNKDNYVGLGEQGLLEYRLTGQTAVDGPVYKVDPAICPATPYGTQIAPNAAPVHNDGVWVREFLPVGWGPEIEITQPCKTATPHLCQDTNPYDFNDNDARVWADWGYPGDPPGNQCFARPHPRGTWHSVSGVQTWADCYLQNRIRETLDDNGLGSTYDGVKGTNCEQSSVASYRPGCNPYGEESQKAYVDAFDCNPSNPDDRLFRSPNTGGTVVSVSRPKASPGVNPDGSMAGTMNETNGDFVGDCRENRDKPLPTEWAGPYATEADITNLNGARNQHDMVMFYNRAPRPAAPQPAYNAVGKQTSEDAGLGAVRQAELWVGNSVTAASRNPYVDRASLGSTFSDVWSMTFYAFVSGAAKAAYTLELPASSSGSYGSEACGTAIGPGQPPKNSWLCDGGLWWPDEKADCVPGRDDGCQRVWLGGEIVDSFVRPGQAYFLRDTDCWDHSATALRDEGVHYGALSGSACT